MQDLLKHAERVAALLKQRNETVAVSESSTGGLVQSHTPVGNASRRRAHCASLNRIG